MRAFKAQKKEPRSRLFFYSSVFAVASAVVGASVPGAAVLLSEGASVISVTEPTVVDSLALSVVVVL